MINKLKYIGLTILGILAALFFLKRDNNPVPLDTSGYEEVIKKNADVIENEEEKRKQIEQEVKDEQNKPVNDQDVAAYFANRKS